MNIHVGPLRWALLATVTVATTALAGCTSPDAGVITQSVETALTSTALVSTSSAGSASTTPPAESVGTSSELSSSEAAGATSAWPSDFTPAQQEAARASVNAVLGFQDVLVQAQGDPAGKDWTADFRKYATKEVTDPTVAGLASMVTAGVHVSVPYKFGSPVVTSADSNRVVVEVCLDASAAVVADASGNPVGTDMGTPRSVTVYNLALYAPEDGGWLIFETPELKPVRPC